VKILLRYSHVTCWCTGVFSSCDVKRN